MTTSLTITDRLNQPETVAQWQYKGYNCAVLLLDRPIPDEWEWQMNQSSHPDDSSFEYPRAVPTSTDWTRKPCYYTGYTQLPTVDDYAFTNAPVYGGITYGPDNDGWIGFDTMHNQDIHKDETGRVFEGSCFEFDHDPTGTAEVRVWTRDTVINETEKLVEWLVESHS